MTDRLTESTADLDDLPATTPHPAAWLIALGLLLGLAGLAVAVYLTYEHYSATPVYACPVTGTIDCAKVTASSYSKAFGIPVVDFGLAFFVVLLALLSPWAWRSASPVLRAARLGWVTVGLLSVFYLVYAEVVEVGAICLYCTAVHVLTFAVFLVVVYAETLHRFEEPVGYH